MDNNRALLLAVLAAAACAGAYILWGPSRRQTRKARVPGLVNLGRSCFLNSVLQALASCRAIVGWLAALDEQRRTGDAKQQQQPGKSRQQSQDGARRLVSSLSWMLRVLNRQVPDQDQTDVADANDVLRALHSHRWLISNDEQDAHEMFHVLTTTIEEEVQARVIAPCSLADLGQLMEPTQLLEGTALGTSATRASSRTCESLPSQRRHETQVGVLPFRGLLASQLKCRSCNSKSPVKFDSFDSLSLSIPTGSWTRLTLLNCLRHFMKLEHVHEVECDRCSATVADSIATSPGPKKIVTTPSKVKSTFVKQLAIGKLPEVLCIHIQRMAWLDNGIPVKKYEHVLFPEFLSMNEFVYCHHKDRDGSHQIGCKSSANSLVGGSRGDAPERSRLVNSNGAALPISASLTKLGLCNEQRSSCSSPKPQCESSSYRLRAVIVHLGDVYSGHFVTYRRGVLGYTVDGGATAGGSGWYLCSDTAVQPVSVKDVLNCDAYMLLYERTTRPAVSTTTSTNGRPMTS